MDTGRYDIAYRFQNTDSLKVKCFISMTVSGKNRRVTVLMAVKHVLNIGSTQYSTHIDRIGEINTSTPPQLEERHIPPLKGWEVTQMRKENDRALEWKATTKYRLKIAWKWRSGIPEPFHTARVLHQTPADSKIWTTMQRTSWESEILFPNSTEMPRRRYSPLTLAWMARSLCRADQDATVRPSW